MKLKHVRRLDRYQSAFLSPTVVCSRVVHLHSVAKTVMGYSCG